jgi:hypothetical protein
VQCTTVKESYYGTKLENNDFHLDIASTQGQQEEGDREWGDGMPPGNYGGNCS